MVEHPLNNIAKTKQPVCVSDRQDEVHNDKKKAMSSIPRMTRKVTIQNESVTMGTQPVEGICSSSCTAF